jgi:hypothetical protein
MQGIVSEEVSGLSNREFLEKYAGPGYVGLAGGDTRIERAIRRAQRRLTGQRERSLWSHAFLFAERRMDGHRWLLESDIEVMGRQVRLGVQENRAAKYWDEEAFANLAVLDFGLSEEQARVVLASALDLLAGSAHYSLRELVGTLLAIHRPTLRSRENLLAREGALYCSALVQHCYLQVGMDFAEGVSTKNTTPQDIFATPVAHRAFLLVRHPSR